MGETVAYGDEWLGDESVGKREDKIAVLLNGNQAVSTTEPDWDYNAAKGRWDQSHFVRYILEGLRQARSKPLNYSKLADIEQEEKEALGKFLDRLREALCRFTEIDPESEEGKVIAYGDEWFDNESVEKREDEIATLPSGNQAVPTIEPDWNYAITWLKEDGIGVTLSYVFLKDSRHAKTLCQIGKQDRKRRKLLVNS